MLGTKSSRFPAKNDVERSALNLHYSLQYLVKSVRAEATPKMTPPAKILCESHTIDSRASKYILWATQRNTQ